MTYVDQMAGLHIMNADMHSAKHFGKRELIETTYAFIRKRKQS
jgi:hypothetical protein